jgi:DNA primase
MGIVAEDVTRVREATDLVALVSQHLALKRVGTNWMGLCPFHGEKSPSFSVSAEKGFYHCFGCGKSGDAISFLMEQEHLDFVGAVEQLAAKVGITLRYDDRAQGEGRRERMKLVEVMEAAVEWYHQRLLTSPDAGPARSYLRNRGIDGDTARRYRIGWAPDDWDQLSRALSKHGKLLETTGLAFQNRRDRRQDFFRNRVLFPIFDAQGDPVSFGGRVMPGGEGPKYRNTSETPLYHKSRVLYGLNWAKSDVVNANEVIVCEGYTDVIGFAAAGVPRAVATCGTALTEEHVTQLRKFARRILLAFDPDSAGKAAADRVYAWERSHDIDVAVVDLPAGDDPADLARRDPEALQAAVAGARPFLGYRVERVLSVGDLTSPEGRARTAEAALGVIAEHPSELVRDPSVMEVADRCRLEPERLRERLARGGFTVTVPGRRGGAAGGPGIDDERSDEMGPARPRRRRRASAAETEALRLAVHRPTEVMPLLAATLFADPLHREVFAALQVTPGDVHAAAAAVGPDGAELLASVAVDAGGAEPLDVVVRLVEQAGRRALDDLERAARGAADPLAYAPAMSWLKLKLEELRIDPLRVLADDEQLVSWLGQRDAEQA